MENIIYNDLIRRGYNVDVGVVEYTQIVYLKIFKESFTENLYVVTFFNIIELGN